MEAFGHDARDEEVVINRPVRERDDRRVELLYIVGLRIWWGRRHIVNEVGNADVVCVRVWFGGAGQQQLEVGEIW
jgi:hypothetical protein